MARSTTGIAYALFGIVILGGMVFTVFVTIPAWSAWQATRDVLAQRVSAKEERARFLQNIDARLQELKAVEGDAKVLSVAFPDHKAPADATAIVGALAGRNGLTARVVTGPELRKEPAAPEALVVTPADTASFLREGGAGGAPGTRAQAARGAVYEFQVKVRGTYTGLNAFLRDLEKSVRFFDIAAVDFKGGAQDGSVEADLKILTYIAETGGSLLPGPLEAGPLTGPAAPATGAPVR